MRFEPMEFSTPHGSVGKPHQGFSFEFAPPPSPIALAKKRENADMGPVAISSMSVMSPISSKCIRSYFCRHYVISQGNLNATRQAPATQERRL